MFLFGKESTFKVMQNQPPEYLPPIALASIIDLSAFQKIYGNSILLGTHTDPPKPCLVTRYPAGTSCVLPIKKTHVSRLEDSQYWVTKNGLGGAAYTMIQNHKGGFDSASGMSKSARE